MKSKLPTEGKGIKNIFNTFAGNKDCPKCHGEGSYKYDDMHGKVCELCCTHPKGFKIPNKRYYDDQTPTCFTCGKKQQTISESMKSKQSLKEGWEKRVAEILETVYDKAIEGDGIVDGWKQRTLFFNGENLKSVIQDLLYQTKSQIVEQILGMESMKPQPEGWGIGSGARIWGRNQLRLEIKEEINKL